MKTEKYKSLGLEWPIPVPESVEEYDLLAKRTNGCLEDAIDHTIFHGTLGDIREEFTSAIDASLQAEDPPIKIAWESGRKDADGDDILLSEEKWLNKALAETGRKVESFLHLQAAVLEKVKFDPSVRERKAGQPKKIPQAALNSAKQLLALHGKPAPENPEKTVDVNAIVAALVNLNPTAPPVVSDESGLPNEESLARLIVANEARKRAARKLTVEYADPAALA